LVRLEQEENASILMLATLSGIVMLVSWEQFSNALYAMLVTLLGIVMLVSCEQPVNAKSPMQVTGNPLIAPGMVTEPPEPVYLVMVMAPLLVV
jgi:hypothetical protein